MSSLRQTFEALTQELAIAKTKAAEAGVAVDAALARLNTVMNEVTTTSRDVDARLEAARKARAERMQRLSEK